jgi:hypothetical protein
MMLKYLAIEPFGDYSEQTQTPTCVHPPLLSPDLITLDSGHFQRCPPRILVWAPESRDFCGPFLRKVLARPHVMPIAINT